MAAVRFSAGLLLFAGLVCTSSQGPNADKDVSTEPTEAEKAWYYVPRDGDLPAYYWNPRLQEVSLDAPDTTSDVFLWHAGVGSSLPAEGPSSLKVISPAEMQSAASAGKLYLVVLGKVYDVTNGKDYYGPGSGYNIFVGRDCSRAFVSGDFHPDRCNATVDGLTPEEVSAILDWSTFYANHQKYGFVGVLAPGLYYSDGGHKTSALRRVEEVSAVVALVKRVRAQLDKYAPGCSFSQEQGKPTKHWCDSAERKLAMIVWRIPSLNASRRETRCGCVPADTTFVTRDSAPSYWRPLDDEPCGLANEAGCEDGRGQVWAGLWYSMVDVYPFDATRLKPLSPEEVAAKDTALAHASARAASERTSDEL